jgi:hypothetical protein
VLTIPSRVIATCFALVAFSATAAVGVFAGNSPSTVIVRAIVVMIAAWIIGRIVGAIAQQTINDHIARYKEANPLPDEINMQDAAGPTTEPAQGATRS